MGKILQAIGFISILFVGCCDPEKGTSLLLFISALSALLVIAGIKMEG